MIGIKLSRGVLIADPALNKQEKVPSAIYTPTTRIRQRPGIDSGQLLARSYLPETTIEIINPNAPSRRVRVALFDFDGTLSLIREGWQGVMIPYFVEELLGCPNAESVVNVKSAVREFVEKLTGKQTIYQCFQLIEEIRQRGGEPSTALEYKHEYLRRLGARIQHRLDGLADGTIAPDSLLVPGSRMLLDALTRSGIDMYLASGTDIQFVLAESKALGISNYFRGRIYGALDKYQDFSKKMIIDRILRGNGISGPELLLIGDGYVEIQNGKGVGGLTLGVASDEANPGGIDDWKRNRLIEAGADIIVPDFSETLALLKYIGTETAGGARTSK